MASRLTGKSRLNYRLHSFLKIYLPLILALFILLWLLLFAYQKHLQDQVRKKTAITTPNGINSMEKVTLGGIEQWILIRGRDQSAPLLLFLHGGPGAPLFPYARDLGVKAKLEQHFVMVYWEQRGSGKSFSPAIPPESMTIEQLVADTHQLTTLLQKRFDAPKIFLIGRSFGSLVGILTVKDHPELYYAYIGIGQLVAPLENDSISCQFTLKTAARLRNEKALQELKEIGFPPYTYKELIIQRKWLTKFDEKMMAHRFNKKSVNYRKKLLSTPEYTLIDIFKMGLDPFFSTRHLWNEKLYRINLFQQVPRLEIPLYFLAGRYDYFTPSEIVEEYYHKLNAPEGKELIWFENSAHEPEMDQPEKFYDVMVNKVLQEE
jgi:pimeloyl-ACP methyl ester carboxylesterase